MVWRYTEYAGCPYLTDWDKKYFKFGIILDEDSIIGEPMALEQLVPSVKFKTNGILRPHFYLRTGQNSSSVFNLEFEQNKGLVRKLWTFDPGTFNIEEFPGEFLKLNPQKIDTGEFEDFRRIGEYATRRFHLIAQEVTAPPYEFNEDVPDDEKKEIEAYFEKTDIMTSWEAVQKDLSQDFWKIFMIYTIFEVTKKGLVRRQNPFTREQIQELHKLVEPLK